MLANYRLSIVQRQLERKNVHANIILANTLSNCLLGEDANPQSIVGQELVRASKLSSLPIKLIIGNPPCSDSNRYVSELDFARINSLMEDFRPPENLRTTRQNIQRQINNPFMQFLRWSCEKLLKSSNHSVLAFVVPLSFLEAESYKYARKFLVEHFSRIWVVAIDADSRAGVRGDGLFATMQGRAVILLTRRYADSSRISHVHYQDISRSNRTHKEAFLGRPIETIMSSFQTFEVMNTTYSFTPLSRPFDKSMYNTFWPINANQSSCIFINQCSGGKLAPTALLTHVNRNMLRRRSREIAKDGEIKAAEWIGRQDKKVAKEKILAFKAALNSCPAASLEQVFQDNIISCSFRPFVNSYAFLWETAFRHQAGVGGGGARMRPEIKAVYEREETIGFSLAHAPKDLDESLGQFASFCWYFPDNDLSRRGNGHIYLNQYVPDAQSGRIVNNVHHTLLSHYCNLLNFSKEECARRIVFYSYAIFCSQVYLEEFYGALFVVNQSEQRARIPVVSDGNTFTRLSNLGERLANLEHRDSEIENVLELDYQNIEASLPKNFRLAHGRGNAATPYDEEKEELILRDDITDQEVRIPCPVQIQRFTVAGYNIVKDCWLKFHSYRYTYCTFSKNDLKELLDLLNKITLQNQYVNEIDDIFHEILNGSVDLLNYPETVA